jgi:tetratricopeptide (TPR) repeat protein
VRAAALCAVVLILASCAAGKGRYLDSLLDPGKDPPLLELSEVPFFPQRAHHCGPSSLATLLTFSGVDVTPDDLADMVYLPGREGSLTLELKAASRRLGRMPYRLAAELEEVVHELQAGRPVLVFLNLGSSRYPIWHFAVVVGYAGEEDRLILRSGSRRRQSMRVSKFLGAWRRAGSWALVVVEPGELPATAREKRFVREAAALEEVGKAEAARRAFGAAVRRWPENEVALLGLGNSLYATGMAVEAAETYAKLARLHRSSVAALNNLAHVLAELGCREESMEALRRGQALSGKGGRFSPFLAATAEFLQRRSFEGDCPFPDIFP